MARSLCWLVLCVWPVIAFADNPKQSSDLVAKKTDEGILVTGKISVPAKSGMVLYQR